MSANLAEQQMPPQPNTPHLRNTNSQLLQAYCRQTSATLRLPEHSQKPKMRFLHPQKRIWTHRKTNKGKTAARPRKEHLKTPETLPETYGQAQLSASQKCTWAQTWAGGKARKTREMLSFEPRRRQTAERSREDRARMEVCFFSLQIGISVLRLRQGKSACGSVLFSLQLGQGKEDYQRDQKRIWAQAKARRTVRIF